ncbi:MAG TPA: hypothetical protein ENI69_01565 [Rhodospirillales bacterium]|nr:hypothetical protein [Rhodospirillales bacterium]
MTAPDINPRLYLSRLDDDYDASRDVVCSLSCFTGFEDRFDDWQSLEFRDPFPTIEAVEEASEAIRKFNAHWINSHAGALNNRHGTDYSRGFWYMMVTPWLSELLQYAWSMYRLLDAVVADHHDRPLSVRVWQGEHDWNFSCGTDFYSRGMYHQLFDWWLRSRILGVIAPNSWRLIGASPTAAEIEDNLRFAATASYNVSGPRQLVRRIRESLAFTLINGARISAIPLALFANLLPKKDAPPIEPTAWLEDDFDPRTVFPQAFLDVLETTIEETTPLYLRDGFTPLIARAKQTRFVKGRVRFGTFDYGNTQERAQAALGLEAGEKLVQVQHGGVYAMLRAYMSPGENEYFGHAFLTWGWTDNQNYPGRRYIPAPSPLLSSYANTHRFRDRSLVIVTTAFWTGLQRIYSGPRSSRVIAWRDQKVSFVKALKPDIIKETIYRPFKVIRPNIGELDNEYFIKRVCPNLRILKGDLHGPMFRCRLLVLDHPGTTLNIAMAANVPTICLWDDDTWALSSNAKPIFDAMRDCNMFFASPEAAADFINTNWDTIEKWWSSPAVRDARAKFCHEFARTRRLWWLDWLSVLRKI